MHKHPQATNEYSVDLKLADVEVSQVADDVVDSTLLVQNPAVLPTPQIVRQVCKRGGPSVEACLLYGFTCDGDPLTFFEDIVDTHPGFLHEI